MTTLEMKDHFVRPMTAETGEARADGHVPHPGRSISLCEAKFADRQGRLVASCTGICLVMPREKRQVALVAEGLLL